jgi:hypothetical protein
MTFQSGAAWQNSGGNHSGRRVGSKNKDGRDYLLAVEECDKRGYPHPFLMMMEWAMDETKPLELRVSLLKEAVSYRVAKPKQTVVVETEVPQPSSIEEAESFLAALSAEYAQELTPLELSTLLLNWIKSKREGKELELKALKDDTSTPVRVEIIGGLPNLPATNIKMPHNGHAIEGHLINGQQDPEKNSGTPAPQPQTQDPEP